MASDEASTSDDRENVYSETAAVEKAEAEAEAEVAVAEVAEVAEVATNILRIRIRPFP